MGRNICELFDHRGGVTGAVRHYPSVPELRSRRVPSLRSHPLWAAAWIVSCLVQSGCAGALTTDSSPPALASPSDEDRRSSTGAPDRNKGPVGLGARSPMLPSDNEEEAIREVAARYLLGRTFGAKEICFVQFGQGEDPPDEFLNRLAASGFDVRKGSAAVLASPKPVADGAAYRDRLTGELGVHLTLSNIRPMDDGKVEVTVSLYANALHASGAVCVMERSGRSWRVVRERVSWES